MNILGIGGYAHGAAAALVQDGRVVAAVAEERLTRVKHQGGAPTRAVAWCLQEAGLSMEDLDHVGCALRPGRRLARGLPYHLMTAFRGPIHATACLGYELMHNRQYASDMRQLCPSSAQLHYLEHHPAHAASAFLASPFEEAALLTIDYAGEWAATWTGTGRGTAMAPHRQINLPHSLGVFYSALTSYLGFRPASDEYKIMELAAYGEPIYYDDLKKVLRPVPGGSYRINQRYMAWQYLPGARHGFFSDRFLREFGPARRAGDPLADRHRNLAASAQRLLEDTVLEIAGHLHRETGLDSLCLAGGVALNGAMIGRLKRESPFAHLWVQPAAGNDGTAIGAALQLYHRFVEDAPRQPMRHAALGPRADHAEIQACLARTKTPYTHPDDIAAEVARLLAEGAVVGWYQGAMEFGPRALGHRSILADPARREMRDFVNKHVKFRDDFHPLAPSVLADRAADYFEGCADSPFKTIVYPVRPEKQAEVPAITHVDGMAPVQTVTEASNPRFYALIQTFEAYRGTPMVLNTSFNITGEPIVHTPYDALKCFYSTGMDALALGDFLVVKNP